MPDINNQIGTEARRVDGEWLRRVREDFVAHLSQGLRPPLNAILGWAQLLQSDSTGATELAEGLEVIIRNARGATQLLDDFADLTRLLAGEMRLASEPVALPEVIAAAVENAAPAAQARGIRLEHAMVGVAGCITGDAKRLQQMAWNLLINAIRTTPDGGRVDLALQRLDACVELTVTNTGKGISCESLPYLFERTNLTGNGGASGFLGLGLALAKSLAEMHGGTVQVRRGADDGSKFMVSLPLAMAPRTISV